MATTVDAWQGFFIKPSGEVEEIDPSGDSARWWQEDPSFYDTLVLAGYPLSGEDSIDCAWIDLSVDRSDPRTVTVHTSGAGSHEHDMRAASALFLSWYHATT